MQKAHIKSEVLASGIEKINEISRTAFGSEDDLINKVVLPFFQVIGYGPDSFELKLPVQGYRPSRPGRKPEADCVFFSGPKHDGKSSLLVAEIKRDDPEFPEQQARFYSANLFVPFYIAWSGFAFEVWQVQNFRPPALVGRYRLDQMDSVAFAELKELLAPGKVEKYCADNEIKLFDHDNQRQKLEAQYLGRLAADLCSFKALDFPQIRDLDAHYIDLGLREHDVVPVRAVKPEIEQGEHPEAIGKNPEDGRTFHASDLLESESAIANYRRSRCWEEHPRQAPLPGQRAYADSRRLPILVSVKELSATGETLVDYALRQIALYGNTDNPRYLYDDALAKGRILLCVDGIDELGIDDPKDARAAIVRFNAELSTILGPNTGNRVVITARRESWPACRPLLSQTLREFVVLPLTRSAVRSASSRSGSRNRQTTVSVLLMFCGPEIGLPIRQTHSCSHLLAHAFRLRANSHGERLNSMIASCRSSWNSGTRLGASPTILLSSVSFPKLHCRFLPHWRSLFTGNTARLLLAQKSSALFSNICRCCRRPFQRPVTCSLNLRSSMACFDLGRSISTMRSPISRCKRTLRPWPCDRRLTGIAPYSTTNTTPFWREATLLYAELGDISDLARDLLETTDDLLASNLLLLADCWAAGGEILDANLSRATAQRLALLAKGDNRFLADQAINVLARIPAADAKTTLAGMMRTPDGSLAKGTVSC